MRLKDFRGVLGVLCLLSPVASQALSVSPAGPFAATGRLAMGKGFVPVSCDTTFTGNVSASGDIVISTVVFSGGNPLCKRISPLGLPWSGHADSDSQFTIHAMQVNVRAPLLGGSCGPVDVAVAWEKENSAAHFKKVTLTPNCTMDGIMVTSPGITVTP